MKHAMYVQKDGPLSASGALDELLKLYKLKLNQTGEYIFTGWLWFNVALESMIFKYCKIHFAEQCLADLYLRALISEKIE